MISANMGRYYSGAKDEADRLRQITVFDLKQWNYFIGRRSGTVTWTSGWDGSKNSISVMVDLDENNPHLRIWYTQTDRSTDEKTNFDYNIPLVTSKCNLGGKRYWFICPWYRNGRYCGRRVAKLYMGGKYFACRHCYDLSYSSRNENRRFYLFPLGQILDGETKIEKLRAKVKTKLYNGKPTRNYRRLLKAIHRTSGVAASQAYGKLEKILGS